MTAERVAINDPERILFGAGISGRVCLLAGVFQNIETAVVVSQVNHTVNVDVDILA